MKRQIEQPLAYARAHRVRFVSELADLIRFPTVSGQPRHARDLRRCAEWLASHLGRVGLEHVHIIPTSRHPLVYADWRHAPGAPTVLIYGHYDVQPAEPLDAWHTPPFEPVRRGRNLHGRGASDDKGQLFVHMKAVESLLRSTGTLPVNVKMILEGEEEIGSASLLRFIEDHRDELSADVVVISDMRIPSVAQPAITESLRGMLSLELDVYGADVDLHSGIFGGAIANPLQALCEILAGLHDRTGRIAIPGFYDHVRVASARERAEMARTGPTDAEVLRDAKARSSRGEPGFTLYESTTIRPALTTNGISGGYQGRGPKAVIPAIARAKLGFRLVGDQSPVRIDRLFREHVARYSPPWVRCVVRTIAMADPVRIDRTHPAFRAVEAAYHICFGAAPMYLKLGGTIPPASAFQKLLGAPIAMMGFALPDDRLHAPDEKFDLECFFRGIDTSIVFLSRLGPALGFRRAPDSGHFEWPQLSESRTKRPQTPVCSQSPSSF
jgi:acetylornithine deacetylase/succinyl-diaminopimelate desuccinylase-like protein